MASEKVDVETLIKTLKEELSGFARAREITSLLSCYFLEQSKVPKEE
jgi:hypothetical protein